MRKIEPASEALPPLGLIAGSGAFPWLVARGAKRAGRRLVVVGLRYLADEKLADVADGFYWSGIARLGRWIRVLRREGVEEAILAGSVRKTDMLVPLPLLVLRNVPDWTTIRLWFFRLPDRRNDTVLCAIGDELHHRGVTLVDSTKYCKQAMAQPGLLTRTQPTAAQRRDADLGWHIAKEMGRLDVGQSVAVMDGDVIAVEAIEGTDRMIERAGQLCRKAGWVHVKVAKPDQDMRFDVPTIGPDTIENLHKARAGCLVVEAGLTLVVDREKTVALADRYGIAVLGRADAPPEGEEVSASPATPE